MNAIVDETRSWIGTPYMHQHATKGAGCDCLGLLRGVYCNVIGPEPETPPAYSASWGEIGTTEHMLDAANRWLTPVYEKGEYFRIKPADVLVFRMRRGRIAKHCAIASGGGMMIHADMSSRQVIECHISDYWLTKIVGVYQF